MPDADGRRIEREVIRHPGAVVVLPILDEGLSGSIVFVRNLRPPIGHVLEAPAGTIEPGEDPASCAHRELIEETGYRAATLRPLGWFYTTPGITDERMHAFVATDLTHVGASPEDDEALEAVTIPAREALSMLDRGEINDGKTIVALLQAVRRTML